MNDLTSKFNLYDHFGYIMVGLYQIFLIFLLLCLLKLLNFVNILEFVKIESSIIILIVSYFLGHIIQAVSNLFEGLLSKKFSKGEEDKKEKGNDQFVYIYEKAKKFFNLPNEIKQKIVFQYCYLYALSNDLGGQIALFNSSYSFYRGLFVSSSINFIILLILGMSSFFIQQTAFLKTNFLFYLFIILNIAIIFLFYNRKERFFKYFGEKVLINFDIISR